MSVMHMSEVSSETEAIRKAQVPSDITVAADRMTCTLLWGRLPPSESAG